MKKELLNEKVMEENVVTLIEDEDYEGAGTPAVVSAVTAVTALIGITTGCTRDCWHPGK